MQLIRFDNVEDFCSLAEPFLRQKEAENNLLLGILTRLKDKPTAYGDKPPYMALIEEKDRVLGVALRTPPRSLLLSMTDSPDTWNLLVRDLYKQAGEIPGVQGAKGCIEPFLNHWKNVTEQNTKISMKLRIYKLKQVVPVENVAGKARFLEVHDRDVVQDWFTRFHESAVPHDPPPDAEDLFNRYVQLDRKDGGLMVWEDESGQVVSMALYMGDTGNGMRIGYVYTPPEHRKQGYASGVVAAVSQQVLDLGKQFCFLFTDLNNPTSNKIYQDIGYEAVVDVNSYELF